jgi:hypothetical protein
MDRMTHGGTNTLTLRGLEDKPFFQLCCCVSFCFGGK